MDQLLEDQLEDLVVDLEADLHWADIISLYHQTGGDIGFKFKSSYHSNPKATKEDRNPFFEMILNSLVNYYMMLEPYKDMIYRLSMEIINDVVFKDESSKYTNAKVYTNPKTMFHIFKEIIKSYSPKSTRMISLKNLKYLVATDFSHTTLLNLYRQHFDDISHSDIYTIIIMRSWQMYYWK